MVIFMDIKSLIIAGFVLVLLNLSDGLPLYNRREPRNSVLQGRMTMLRKSCIDSVGNMGICMFKWDCISQQGITLSTCVDGFLFGACCSVKDNSQGILSFNSDYESTTNNKYESTTNNEYISKTNHESTTKSNYKDINTISVIEYETLSSLVQNLNVSTLQDNSFTEEFLSTFYVTPDNINEIFKFDENVTLTETNKSTSLKVDFEESNTLNDISSNANLLDLKFSLNAKNDTNNSYFQKDLIDIEVSDAKTENHSDIEQKSSSNSGSSVLETKIHSFKVNRTKNAMTESGENEEFSIYVVANEGSHINAKNDLLKSEESVSSLSAIVDNHTTANYFSSEITHNLQTESTYIQTFHTDSKNTEFETTIDNDVLYDIERDFITEKNSVKTNISLIDVTKDAENFSTEGIPLPVWGENLPIFPSSFQYLISQLTSKETINSDTTINTNTQSTGTILNEKDKTTISEFVTENAEYVSELEIYNVDKNLSVDERHVVSTANEVNTQFDINHNSTLSSDSIYSGVFNATTSITPQIYGFLETSTASKNLYTGTTKISVNDSDEILFSINEKSDISSEEILPSISKDQLITDTSIGVTNNVLHEYSLLLSQNYTEGSYLQRESPVKTYLTTKNTEQILPPSTTKDVADSTSSNNYQLNFDSNEYEFKPTNSKISEKEIIQETTFTRPFTIHVSSTTKIPNQDITPIECSTNVSCDNKENIDQNSNKTEDSRIKTEPLLSLSTTSAQSTIHNQEFLFDITTDILKFFSKPEINNIDSSDHKQTDYFPSSFVSEQNLSFESIETDFITPSQTYAQKVYDTTFESTVSEVLDSFPSNHFSSESTEIISENTKNELEVQTDTFKNESSILGFGEHVYLGNLSTIESWNTENFSTTGSVYKETAIEYSEPIEPSSNFGEPFTTDIFSPVTKHSEEFVTDIASETKSNYTFFGDHSLESTNTSYLTTDATGVLQAVINGTSGTLSSSGVNESTLIATEKNSVVSSVYIYANVSTTSPDVNVFTDVKQITPINTSYNKTTSSLFNITSSLTSNSSKSSESTSTVSSTLSTKTQQKPIKEYTWNYKKDCGVRPMQPVGRIVGGKNTYFGKWPWQALVKEATWLGLFVKNKCGGVLITSKYVLTAAHCQPGFLASLLVVLGTHDISNLKDNGLPVIRNVKRMVVHRHYNAQTFENDLALLEMDTELEFMPHVVPICLPHRNEDFTGEMAFVTGWGKLTHGGDVPNILQEVQVPIVANDECQKMFYQAGHQKIIKNNFVCAGYTNGGQDSCEGDSGGPLMVQRKDKRWVLVGTVSHGIGCADPNLPGVYMRMSSYRPWIDSIINK